MLILQTFFTLTLLKIDGNVILCSLSINLLKRKKDAKFYVFF